MLSFTQIITLALASSATAATTGYRTVSAAPSCFKIMGINPNGTLLGYLNVGQYWMYDWYVYGVFDSAASATRFSIDSHAHLIDRSPGNVQFYTPHNGVVASVPQAGSGSSLVWFDTTNRTADPEGANRVALNCQVNSQNARLGCAHPTKPAYSVFHFCPVPEFVTDVFPALLIGAAGDVPGASSFGETCYPITLMAVRAQGCLS
ncbi:hypothetical protein E8E14_011210 [Neopestalotiopsis sp. 37M]|nr:hypothetical protein E8E14_011210 [Neopestalotiopsis sp. 37M]